jgi:uncharacterized protein with HEPN domain
MRKDDAYLLDVLVSARLILSYVKGVSREEFLSSIGLQDQVIRRFEIIGEAARRLSDETKENVEELPWREIIGLRNVLAHDYAEVNLDRLWAIIEVEVPRMIRVIEPLVPPA